MGLEYRVVTKYDLQTGGAQQGVGSLSGMLDSLAGKVAGAIDAMARLGLAAAGLAAVGALGAVKTGLVDVNARLEDSQIGFATIFNMLGASNSFEGGLGMAKTLMEGIRADAASLPGEFGDFVHMAQTLTAPLVNMGKGIQDIRDLTAQTVVSAASLGVQYDQAAREMAMLLEGHAGGHNVLGLRLGITAHTQVSGKDFNKATEEERFAFLTKKMEKAKDSLPAFQNSWSGLTSTMVDGAKRLLGIATGPLFDRMKEQFVRVNKLLDSPAAMASAQSIGQHLANGFTAAVHIVERIAKRWDTIKEVTLEIGDALLGAFEKVWPYVEKIGETLGGILVHNPGGALAGLAAVRLGAGAAPQASAAFEAMSGALGGGAAALGAFSVAVLAAVGVLDLLTTTSQESGTATQQVMVETANTMAEQIKELLAKLWKDVNDTGQKLWEAVQPVADALGIVLLAAVEGLIVIVDGLVLLFGGLAEAVTNAITTLRGTADVKSLKAEPLDKHMTPPPTLYGAGGTVLEDKSAAIAAAAAEKHAAKLKGAGKTSVTNNVTMTITESGDPERLAVKISHELVRVARNPLKALSAATFR